MQAEMRVPGEQLEAAFLPEPFSKKWKKKVVQRLEDTVKAGEAFLAENKAKSGCSND